MTQQPLVSVRAISFRLWQESYLHSKVEPIAQTIPSSVTTMKQLTAYLKDHGHHLDSQEFFYLCSLLSIETKREMVKSTL